MVYRLSDVMDPCLTGRIETKGGIGISSLDLGLHCSREGEKVHSITAYKIRNTEYQDTKYKIRNIDMLTILSTLP